MFGDLLAQRRNKLDLSISELYRRTGMHRSYISDTESGRKFPSLQWVEKLARLDPPDPELVRAYHAAAFERAAAMKWPASRVTAELAHELVRAPTARGGDGAESAARPGGALPARPTLRSVTGKAHCLQEAVALIERAAAAGPPSEGADGGAGLDAVLLVYSPSLERSALDWRAALRGAIDADWTVVHVLSAGTDTIGQIQRVRDLIALISRGPAYTPLVLLGEAPAPEVDVSAPVIEFVVAPGHGVLQLYGGGTAATFFPWQGQYVEVCRNLARTAHAVQARSTQLVRVLLSADPTAQEPAGWLGPLPAKVVFDQALTNATVRGGRRALMKSGLVLATTPPWVTLKLAARLMGAAQAEQKPLIENLTKNRLQRWEAIHGNHTEPNQHLCPIPALLAYLADEAEPGRRAIGQLFIESDPLFSGMELTREERIEHMRGVVDLLRSRSQYEVGLVESPDAVPVPVGQSYWFCTEAALFVVSSRQDTRGTRFVTIQDRAVVEGFFQVFDAAWEAVPARWRDRTVVADQIERWIDRAERNEPMMAQPRAYAELGG